MRYNYIGVTKDQGGKILASATVSVYLTGTTTAAKVYTASTGGSSVGSVTSGTDGAFKFFVDFVDYTATQQFDITISATNYQSKTYGPLSIFPETITNDPYVDVRAYGAVGNGVTDDTAAIQNAINSLLNGGIVFFPLGTYKITSTLTLASLSGVRLIGAGQAASVVVPVTKLKAGASLTNLISMTNTRDSGIENFNLDGNSQTTNLLSITGTGAQPVTNLYFGNIQMMGATNGILLGDSTINGVSEVTFDRINFGGASPFLNTNVIQKGDNTTGIWWRNSIFYISTSAPSGSYNYKIMGGGSVEFYGCEWGGGNTNGMDLMVTPDVSTNSPGYNSVSSCINIFGGLSESGNVNWWFQNPSSLSLLSPVNNTLVQMTQFNINGFRLYRGNLAVAILRGDGGSPDFPATINITGSSFFASGLTSGAGFNVNSVSVLNMIGNKRLTANPTAVFVATDNASGGKIFRLDEGGVSLTNLTNFPFYADDGRTIYGNLKAANIATTYDHSGTQQTNAHIVQDTVTLSSGTATVTLTGSAVFTSASSYTCVAEDDSALNVVKVTQTSGSSITFTGTGTDVIRYIAIGN